jgi:hypothetical protein
MISMQGLSIPFTPSSKNSVLTAPELHQRGFPVRFLPV